ncbi:phosphate transport system permease protein PstA [Angustibacter aerolatus]|uniref:Phosphate transport system permease protein PstA n=1 Tax=Angustibacter aerolatus TaxID=1162965 RepID=A0ABQ6JIM2_9ACTN|nr:phosphate transport system permease protein PstA [Angustibacter aerolatus]
MTVTTRPPDAPPVATRRRPRRPLQPGTGGPGRTQPDAVPARQQPRPVGRRGVDDVASLVGALAGSLGLTWVVFAYLLPLQGKARLRRLLVPVVPRAVRAGDGARAPRPIVLDRLMSAVVTGGALIVFVALVASVVFTFARGVPALVHPNFYAHDMAGVRPLDPLARGGVLHAVTGSLIEIGIAVAVTLPLGLGTAVYLSEVGGRTARIVRTVVEAMTALPSIVAGLFVYTVLLVTLHFPPTGFTASMAISVMMLPIIARAADVSLRVVPGGLREASLALGASQWQTTWRVVLPTARPGLATALILGIARGVGETSPVLLTSGASTFFNADPLHQPMNSLPLFVFSAVRSGQNAFIARGFGAASVLLALVLALFVVTRVLARQRKGR